MKSYLTFKEMNVWVLTQSFPPSISLSLCSFNMNLFSVYHMLGTWLGAGDTEAPKQWPACL